MRHRGTGAGSITAAPKLPHPSGTGSDQRPRCPGRRARTEREQSGNRAFLRLSPQVRVRFKDTVEGLSPDKLAQLFQPFNLPGQEACAEEGTGSAWFSASNWSS